MEMQQIPGARNGRDSHKYENLRLKQSAVGTCGSCKVSLHCAVCSVLCFQSVAVVAIIVHFSLYAGGALDGGWTEWTTWEQCSTTCGVGLQRRERTCSNPRPKFVGKHCEGESSVYRLCNTKECTGADGRWSSWSSWEVCSRTCGTGLQSRKRSCTYPETHVRGRQCEGDTTEYQLCFIAMCQAQMMNSD